MSTLGRLKTLYYLTLSPIRGDTHQQRLESFYQHQAVDYDDFRERLLHGRDELFAALPVADGQEWIDLGAGTGRNAERFGDRLQRFSSVQLVDLSPSLLEVTHQRIDQHGWSNVKAVHADATSFDPPDGSVDLVTFCYSLTMIPGWFAAVENAWRMLKPGGIIGVVDFYVSRKYPDPDQIRHGWFQRTFWPTWFAMDNVFSQSRSLAHAPQPIRNYFDRRANWKSPLDPAAGRTALHLCRAEAQVNCTSLFGKGARTGRMLHMSAPTVI